MNSCGHSEQVLEPEPAAPEDAPTEDQRRASLLRMDCAGAGGDLRRAVMNLDYLGMLELRAGQPNEALKLFRLGVATAPTRFTRAMLEYHYAWALGLLGLATDALFELRRASESFEAASDESRLWKHFATTLPHSEGRTYLALGRFDRAAAGGCRRPARIGLPGPGPRAGDAAQGGVTSRER